MPTKNNFFLKIFCLLPGTVLLEGTLTLTLFFKEKNSRGSQETVKSRFFSLLFA
jgi:hypothetical protein